MSGFEINGGNIIVTKGSRVVQTTAGTMVNLLPTAFTLTGSSLVYPDVPKGRVETWRWECQWNVGPAKYAIFESSTAQVSATPQEYEATTVLATAPDDIDFFPALLRVNRTVAPTHDWAGGAIKQRVPQNKWIPITGSMVLEQAFGFARLLSVYVDQDPLSANYRKLVRQIKQTVQTPPGGFGSFGDAGPGGAGFTSGGENTFTTGQGLPVYYAGAASPQFKSTNYVSDYNFFPGDYPDSFMQYCKKGNSLAASTSDPTNFGVTYTLDIKGRWGRKS